MATPHAECGRCHGAPEEGGRGASWREIGSAYQRQQIARRRAEQRERERQAETTTFREKPPKVAPSGTRLPQSPIRRRDEGPRRGFVPERRPDVRRDVPERDRPVQVYQSFYDDSEPEPEVLEPCPEDCECPCHEGAGGIATELLDLVKGGYQAIASAVEKKKGAAPKQIRGGKAPSSQPSTPAATPFRGQAAPADPAIHPEIRGRHLASNADVYGLLIGGAREAQAANPGVADLLARAAGAMRTGVADLSARFTGLVFATRESLKAAGTKGGGYIRQAARGMGARGQAALDALVDAVKTGAQATGTYIVKPLALGLGIVAGLLALGGGAYLASKA